MAVPKFSDLFRLVLESLLDGGTHTTAECLEYIVDKLQLSEQDCQTLLPNGRRTVLKDRVHWALTYVRQAGLALNVKRGYNQITEEGRRIVMDSSIELNETYLMKYQSFRQFKNRNKDTTGDKPMAGALAATPLTATPDERMNEAFDELNRALENDILDEILSKKDFQFFERLVVDLVMAMGYGSDEENAGVVTQSTCDGGIDGVISEDKLGFNKIYIQAKCWDKASTVSRPEIQKFVGALAGMGANKGLFITTSQFSKEAIKYAKDQHGAKVVLVDGMRLAKLMIEHGVGVSPVYRYVVKRLDTDYFNLN